MTDYASLAAALQPLISRVRTDVTAVKKANGEQAWTSQPLTAERLARHLNGGPPRGVCPIKPGEAVTLVAVLDFDSHKGEVGWVEMSQVVMRVHDMLVFADGISPILFKSTGGRGVHLYILWDTPQDARSVRLWLKGVLQACGLRSGVMAGGKKGVAAGVVEVFPKQDSVPIGGNGNQFILPLAGKSRAVVWNELAGCLVEEEQFTWSISPAIPAAPPAEARQVVQVNGDDSASAPWRSALDALKNNGEFELEYDAWRNVIFGIHYETQGSDDGLDLAMAWSARSGKHNGAFLENRVWPYVNSERGGSVVTGRSIMSLAARLHGWSEPLNANSFTVVEDDDHGFHFSGGFGSTDSGDSPARGLHAGVLDGEKGDSAADEGSRADRSSYVLDADGSSDGKEQEVRRDRGHELRSAIQAGDTTLAGDATGVDGHSARGDEQPGAATGSGVSGQVAEPARPGGRGTGIPEAEHLVTDQANANRLVRLHGRRVLVAEGRWHAWDGSRWCADESDVYRYACGLSRVVRDEAAEWDRRVARLTEEAVGRMVAVQSGNVSAVAGAAAVGVIATGEGGARAVSGARAVVGEALDAGAVDEIRGAAAQAEALHKWSVKSEMKVTVEAAVGLARKMLGMEADRLDADPWLMNTPSGVVDLRDGSVRPARAGDLMTKLAGVGYVPGADQSVWRGLVSDVCGGDQELMGFLQRWFGYCATGSVREQVFVVHWGGGSNGKGTILETVARVMGDYAVTAAPSLMAGDARGGSERHPTEIASLRGRRMVTAHETDDGAVLREGFVKQATGGDRLVGRFMREDFFEFAPTHKLQLLTNHKPTIRGNDPAIWRRVLLVPYLESFGSAQDVAAGLRTRLADLGLAERLRGDPGALAGVLAWVVDGAVDWAASGLMAPAVVRAAVEEYRSEQDRLGQFVRECCELAPTGLMVALARAAVGSVPWWNDADYRAWSEPMTAGLEGLYPTYAAWCKEMGGHPLARNRFLESLTRSAPRLVAREGLEGSAGAARRRVVRVFGLKLLPQG